MQVAPETTIYVTTIWTTLSFLNKPDVVIVTKEPLQDVQSAISGCMLSVLCSFTPKNNCYITSVDVPNVLHVVQLKFCIFWKKDYFF